MNPLLVIKELLSINDEDKKLILLEDLSNIIINSNDLAKIIEYIKTFQTIHLDKNNGLDIAGTGGSKLQRINTSTISAFLLAKLGITILKHGNNAASGRVGSFDLLSRLLPKISENKEEILESIKKNNIAFLYAKYFFPVFKNVAEVRKIYGKPTIFNILGPLLNPGNTDNMLIGCGFGEYMDLMIETSKNLGKNNIMIVRGEDGLDEVTLTGKTKVKHLHNGKINEYFITPEDFGLNKCDFEEISGGDIETNTNIAIDILSGNNNTRHKDLIAINVATGLYLTGKVGNLKEGVQSCFELFEKLRIGKDKLLNN